MSYISGFVVAVPTKNKEAYRKLAAEAAEIFKDYGAIEMMEAWGEDVRDGKITDFKRAVQTREDETVVFPGSSGPTGRPPTNASGKCPGTNA